MSWRGLYLSIARRQSSVKPGEGVWRYVTSVTVRYVTYIGISNCNKRNVTVVDRTSLRLRCATQLRKPLRAPLDRGPGNRMSNRERQRPPETSYIEFSRFINRPVRVSRCALKPAPTTVLVRKGNSFD